MKRLNIISSTGHVAVTFKSEWQVLLKISWFPLLLLGISVFLSKYVQSKTSGQENYPIEIHLMIENMVQYFLFSIAFIGTYRYLLIDSRFHIKKIILRRNFKTRTPVITTQLYLYIDKHVVIFSILLIFLAFIYEYSAQYITEQMIANFYNSNFNISDSFAQSTLFFMLPTTIWRLFLFFIGSQLCLVFPYIAISNNLEARKILQNIDALRGNRIRVWIVQSLIAICAILVGYIVVGGFLWLTYTTSAKYNFAVITASLLRFIYFIILFIEMLLSTIFGAIIFKHLGVGYIKPAPNNGLREVFE